ncbi:MAG TPA: hypothetical protein DEP19_09100 [Anaerolineae bacterium]|nr:hypothetical protein [Anaerolineae bacterium]HCK64772.1 hypothetical protein [Anaerolineae bacterium]
MSLIDRYVAEVGRHLPSSEREDIEKEIRSTLEDTLEENTQKGKPANDENISTVLKQFGDPELLAQKYSPRKSYLIGRTWYEIYIQILKRVLGTALPIVWLVQIFVKHDASDKLGQVLTQSFGATFNIGIHVWFWITITFVILEHVGVKPSELDGNKNREWSPERLPALPKKRQISFTDAITDLITSVVSIVGGIVLLSISPTTLHPALFTVWVPIFLGITVLSFIHELFKLKTGNWTPALMITNVILNLVLIGFAIAFYTSQQFINPVVFAELPQKMQESIIWTIGISTAILVGIFAWSIYNSIVMSRRLQKQVELKEKK